jgi:transposase
MEPHRRVRHDHVRTGGPGAGRRDGDDRCDPSEDTPDGFEPGGAKRGRGRLIGRTRGGLNSKLHVLADAKGRPIHILLSAGQTSDCIGLRALLPTIPQAGALLADRDYDADWFRNALIELGIAPCIPSRHSRTVQIPHDAALYRLHHKIEKSSRAPRTGAGSRRGMTAARSCPSRHAPSPLSLFASYESGH